MSPWAPSCACSDPAAASRWPTWTQRTARSTIPDAEGIHHHGFERDALADLARAAGFVDVEFRTATEIEHEDRRFPVFLLLGRRP